MIAPLIKFRNHYVQRTLLAEGSALAKSLTTTRIEYAVHAGLPLPSRRALRVGGKRINFLCEFIDANHGRSGRITQGDVRVGDLANILRRAGQ